MERRQYAKRRVFLSVAGGELCPNEETNTHEIEFIGKSHIIQPKPMKTIIALSVCILSSFMLHAQNPEWITYSYGQNISTIAVEGNTVWIGTNLGGLVKLNKTTGEKILYNKANSGLPDNEITAIAIDASGNKWIGTAWHGLAKFDGTNWTVYNKKNSSLPEDLISAIAIDASGNKWIGISNTGLENLTTQIG